MLLLGPICLLRFLLILYLGMSYRWRFKIFVMFRIQSHFRFRAAPMPTATWWCVLGMPRSDLNCSVRLLRHRLLFSLYRTHDCCVHNDLTRISYQSEAAAVTRTRAELLRISTRLESYSHGSRSWL